MILTVFGATGMVGKRLVKLALQNGHTVKAFGRNIESLIDEDHRNDKMQAIKGYVFDEESVSMAVAGSDAVLSVLGGTFDGTDKTRSLGIKNIVKQMEKNQVLRIVAVGGLGILTATDGTMMIENPGYPQQYLPVGKEHLKAFEHLTQSNLNWTFVCPPQILDEEATSIYHTAANKLPVPDNSKITAGDLAAFILSETQKNNYPKQRVGISN